MHELQNDNMAWSFCLNDKQYLRIDGLYYAIYIITKILFRTLSNIYDGAIYGNSNAFQPFTIFTISSILDIDPRFRYISEDYNNLSFLYTKTFIPFSVMSYLYQYFIPFWMKIRENQYNRTQKFEYQMRTLTLFECKIRTQIWEYEIYSPLT